jgi:hypothetical protein
MKNLAIAPYDPSELVCESGPGKPEHSHGNG